MAFTADVIGGVLAGLIATGIVGVFAWSKKPHMIAWGSKRTEIPDFVEQYGERMIIVRTSQVLDYTAQGYTVLRIGHLRREVHAFEEEYECTIVIRPR